MIGFLNSLVTHALLITYKLHRQYSAIADLHTFQFTVAHALGFSVSTSHLLATDLHAETSIQIATCITHEIFQSHFTSSYGELPLSQIHHLGYSCMPLTHL
jgi:hypothetical protein